jgi:hypothetical protein
MTKFSNLFQLYHPKNTLHSMRWWFMSNLYYTNMLGWIFIELAHWKNCMGHISGISFTWELLLREYWRKSMIIGEKNTDLKRLTGRLKLRFLTEIGRFHWNQGEEVPTSPGLVNPGHNYKKIIIVDWILCLGEIKHYAINPLFSLWRALWRPMNFQKP